MKIKLYLISGLLFFFIAGNVFSQGFNSIHTPDGVNIIAAGNAGKECYCAGWLAHRITSYEL